MKTLEKRPLFVVAGPSASGKSSLVKCACETLGLRRAITSTTRKPRPSDDPTEYYFVSREEFDSQFLLEYAEYAGNYYGLSVAEAVCSDVVITDVNGARSLREWSKVVKRPVIVIVLQCSPELLRKRMRKRGDSDEDIQRRVAFYESTEKDDLKKLDSDFRISVEEDFQSVAEKFTQLIQYCREAAIRR